MQFKAIPLFKDEGQPADIDLAETYVIFSNESSGDYIFSLGLPLIWTHSVTRAGTDGVYTYLNPDFMRDLSAAERAFVLAHEVEHVIYKDGERSKFYRERGFFSMRGNERIEWDADLGNRSMDYRINANLTGLGMTMPDDCLLDARFSRDSMLNDIYLALYVKPEEPPAADESETGDDSDEQDSDEQDSEAGGDSDEQDSEAGEGDSEADEGDSEAGEGEGEGEASDDANAPSKHGSFDDHFEPQYEGTEDEQAQAAQDDRDAIEEAVDQMIDTLENEGTLSQSLGAQMRSAGKRHGDEDHRQNVRWEAELADVMVRAGGSGKADYSRINKRHYLVGGSIVPRHKGICQRIVFEIDVSGSVSRWMLGKAMIEMAAAIDALRPVNGCLVLFTNTEVIDDHDVFSGEELLELEVPNCGGTRMAAGVQWLEDNGITDADVHIVFTDGYLDHNDWQVLGDAGVVLVLDSDPDYSMRQHIKSNNIRTIVATDTPSYR